MRAGDVGIRWIVDLGCSPTVGEGMQVLLGQQLAGTARMNDERTVGLRCREAAARAVLTDCISSPTASEQQTAHTYTHKKAEPLSDSA